MTDIPIYHIDILQGPFWEVDTENCETILIQCALVPITRPDADDFQDFIDLSTHAHGEAMGWRKVKGYAAVLRSPRGGDMSPVEGPYEDPKAAWTYVEQTWGDRVPSEGVLADYEDPDGRVIAEVAKRMAKLQDVFG